VDIKADHAVRNPPDSAVKGDHRGPPGSGVTEIAAAMIVQPAIDRQEIGPKAIVPSATGNEMAAAGETKVRRAAIVRHATEGAAVAGMTAGGTSLRNPASSSGPRPSPRSISR
jgi:hypothetical protein